LVLEFVFEVCADANILIPAIHVTANIVAKILFIVGSPYQGLYY
jgi:hypothetical protein